MSTNTLVWNFIGHDKSAGKTVDNIGHKFGKLGKTIGIAVGGAAVAGFAALSAAMVAGVRDAATYQTLQLKTQAVLKSTGNVARTSVKGVRDLASSLENLSGVDENLIINAQNVLLTFTQVRNRVGKGNDIFKQATTAALNMSAALGTDLQAATLAVGKALQDPVKGITALRRAGVMLDKGQQKQIKTLVAHGKTMEAQKIILGELTKEFGGAAKAAGSGFEGSLARLKDAFGDAFRDIGTKVLPYLTSFAKWLGDKVPGAIDKAMPYITAVGRGVRDLFAGLTGKGPAKGFVGTLNTIGLSIRALFLAMKDGDVTSDGMIGTFERIGVALRNAWGVGKKVWGFLANDLFPVIKAAVQRTLPMFREGIDNLKKAFSGNGETAGKLSGVFKQLWGFIKAYVIPTVVWLYAKGFLTLTRIIRVLAWVFQKIVVPALVLSVKQFMLVVNATKAVIRWLGTAKDKVIGWFTKAKDWLKTAGRNVVDGLFSGLKDKWRAVSTWFGGVKAKVVGFVKSPLDWLRSKGFDVIRGFWLGLVERWRAVKDWVGGIATWIKDHKGPVSLDAKLLVPAGKAIMSGFLTGLKSGAGAAWKFVKSVGGKTKEAIAEAAGWLPGFGWIDAISSRGGNAANQRIGQSMAARYGWTGAQWQALKALWNNESGWNNNAQNPTSTAYGIAQFLNSTWGYVGATKTSNPALQIAAGLKYIAKAYGTPANALRLWQQRSPHWYDKGGLLRPGYTLAYNGTGRAEGIFTAEQMAAMGGAGDVSVRVYIGDQELRGIVRTEVDSGIGRQVRAASTRRTG